MNINHNEQSGGWSRARTLLWATGVAAVAGLVSTAAVALQDDARSATDATRATIEEWVEVRRVIAKEKRDWAVGKEMLEDQIRIVEHQIETLRGRITETQEQIGEAEGSWTELVDTKDALEAASAEFAAQVTELEARTLALLQRLPQSLQDHVRPLSQKIPEDPAGTSRGVGERFGTVAGILQEITAFNYEVRVENEERVLPDGSTIEAETLYVGLGQAYYVSRDRLHAGVGTVSDDGWVWTPANEHAEAIARAVAIWNDEEEPVFVQLPLQVR